MKYLPTIAGILLGLMFVFSAVMVLFNLTPVPKMPEGTPMAMFIGAFGPTGYMHFVKVFELLGGVLVAIPLTRNLGLLCLGPVIVNIVAFHLFITKGEGLLNPMIMAIVVLSLFLLWVERRAWAALVNRPAR